MELFKRPALAGACTKKALQPLVDEILARLVDPKVSVRKKAEEDEERMNDS